DSFPQLRVHCGGWRFLDELLVTALNRAVALAEVHDVAMLVREDLHLDVARVLQIPLHVHRSVGEVRLSLTTRRLERPLDLVGRTSHLEPLPASSRRRLDRDREPDL